MNAGFSIGSAAISYCPPMFSFPAYGEGYPMGKVVMSLAMVTMLAGTAFLFAAPVLLKSDYASTMTKADLCLSRGVGCGQ